MPGFILSNSATNKRDKTTFLQGDYILLKVRGFIEKNILFEGKIDNQANNAFIN